MNTNTPEWISAIAAVISVPISIWAILSSKRNSNNIKQITEKFNIIMKDNTLIGRATLLSWKQKGEKK
jgi:hypothetical protein